MSVRTYRTYTCTTCNKTAKKIQVSEGLHMGNPLYKCQSCGATNYDRYIVEPALMDPQELITDAKKRSRDNTLLTILPTFFVFFALMMGTGNIVLAVVAAGAVFFLFAPSDKKKNTADPYAKEVSESLARLSADKSYADLIIRLQGNHPQSAWSKKMNG